MRKLILFTTLIGTVCLGAGCSDLGDLGGGFEYGDDYQEGDSYLAETPPYPAITGTEIRYNFSRNYLPDHTDYCGGETRNEWQMSGQLCMRISGVVDGWAENTETLVNVWLKVTNFGGTADIDITGANDVCDPYFPPYVEVEERTQNLWQADLFPMAPGHIYYPDEKSFSFGTHGPLNPPNGAFDTLFFFDPRESEDGMWEGWSYLGTTDGASNFAAETLRYYFDTLGLTPGDNSQIKYEVPAAIIATCADFTEQLACDTSPACVWDWGASLCNHANVFMKVVWRETLADGPAEFMANGGDVIHSLLIEYTQTGILDSYDEYIVADGPTAPASLDYIEFCPAWSTACASAKIGSYSGGFVGAPCTF